MGAKRPQWLNTQRFVSLSCGILDTALAHTNSKPQTDRATRVWKFHGWPGKGKESPRGLISKVERSGLGVNASTYNSLVRASHVVSSITGKIRSDRNGVLEKTGEQPRDHQLPRYSDHGYYLLDTWTCQCTGMCSKVRQSNNANVGRKIDRIWKKAWEMFLDM